MFLAVSAVSSGEQRGGSVLNRHITVGGWGGGEEIIRKSKKHIGKKTQAKGKRGMQSGLA